MNRSERDRIKQAKKERRRALRQSRLHRADASKTGWLRAMETTEAILDTVNAEIARLSAGAGSASQGETGD